jgi:hypothetical protein
MLLTLPAQLDLCQAFQKASIETWQRLGAARETGLRYGEETVTDNVLLDLVSACPGRIVCVAYNKLQEVHTGADWEWWFVSGNKGIGFRVQAKRLYDKTQKYDAIRYSTQSGEPSQSDVLVSAATAAGLTPLYVFFSHPRLQNGQRPDPLLGCMVAHGKVIHKIQPRRYDQISKIAVPWHYLVCSNDRRLDRLQQLQRCVAELSAMGRGARVEEHPQIRSLPVHVMEIRARVEVSPPMRAEQSDYPGETHIPGVRGIFIADVSND